jgi:proteasome lid subunit RPN8/RPN11
MIKPAILRHPDPWGPDVIAAIQKHAMAAYPEEACGVVTGDAYVPCDNIHPEPEKAFRIDPEFSGKLMKAKKLQAVVHSHPDGPNHPSAFDQQSQIDMGIPWGVVPVIGDRVAAVACSDILWWGDTLPDVPLERRKFIWGIFHCYSLYRDWMWQERGIRIPNFAVPADFVEQGQNVFVENAEKAGLCNLGKPDIENLQVGDMLVGKLFGAFPNHCGVYVGDDQFLHHPTGGASGKVELLRWWPRIEVVLRYDPSNTPSVRPARKRVRGKTQRRRKDAT